MVVYLRIIYGEEDNIYMYPINAHEILKFFKRHTEIHFNMGIRNDFVFIVNYNRKQSHVKVGDKIYTIKFSEITNSIYDELKQFDKDEIQEIFSKN